MPLIGVPFYDGIKDYRRCTAIDAREVM